MIKSVETFVVDGRPYGAVWVDHGYRSGPKVTPAGSLGAIRYVPGPALDEARAERIEEAERNEANLAAANENGKREHDRAEAAEGKLKELLASFESRGELHSERCENARTDQARGFQDGLSTAYKNAAHSVRAALLDQPPRKTVSYDVTGLPCGPSTVMVELGEVNR